MTTSSRHKIGYCRKRAWQTPTTLFAFVLRSIIVPFLALLLNMYSWLRVRVESLFHPLLFWQPRFHTEKEPPVPTNINSGWKRPIAFLFYWRFRWASHKEICCRLVWLTLKFIHLLHQRINERSPFPKHYSGPKRNIIIMSSSDFSEKNFKWEFKLSFRDTCKVKMSERYVSFVINPICPSLFERI